MPAGVETGISQNSNSHFCSNRHRVYGDASIIPVLLKNFLRFGSRHFSTSFAYSASRPVFSLPECPDLAMKSSSPHRVRRLNPAARSGLSSERPFLLRESLREMRACRSRPRFGVIPWSGIPGPGARSAHGQIKGRSPGCSFCVFVAGLHANPCEPRTLLTPFAEPAHPRGL